MAEGDRPVPAPATDPGPLPEPVLARQNRLRLSLVWVVPIVAVLVGIVLVVRSMLAAGPEISIEFRSAEGIEPGRTEIRFKEVVVGHVKKVRIGADRRKVIVTAALDKSVESLAVDDTRFWVVRPRIGTGGVSGLGTLLSGAYIGADAGASTDSRTEFTGLDSPPLVLRGEPGRSFALWADDLGSLDVGSPIYHRRIRVGRVVGYALDDDSRSLLVQIFVEEPHQRLVTQRTRFWNASGLDFTIGANGLTVNTQSVASVLAGGIAFAEAPVVAAPDAALEGQRFKLFADERSAMAPDSGDPMRVRMVFDQSLRGLDAGAPIDLLGVEIGTVRGIALKHDATAGRLPVEVTADLYPQRLGPLHERFAKSQAAALGTDRHLFRQLVERGLRAQVKTGNLLTGRLFVALEFVPKAPPAAFDVAAEVPTLPTVPGTLADLQPQVAEIVGRLSKVRFEQIGSDTQQALKTLTETGQSLQTAIRSADGMIQQLTPEAQSALGDLRRTLGTAQQALQSAERNLADSEAPLQRNANQALGEMQRAAQALRVLGDYLQRHPETLLRGKPADPDLTRIPETTR